MLTRLHAPHANTVRPSLPSQCQVVLLLKQHKQLADMFKKMSKTGITRVSADESERRGDCTRRGCVRDVGGVGWIRLGLLALTN